MSLSHRYNEFGSETVTEGVLPVLNADGLEDAKLQAFENGYQAGWDDAVAAHTKEREKISADFAQNLQDMSFGYHEAFSKLCTSMEPLMNQIVTKLLPSMVQVTLSGHILDQIREMMVTQADNAIEIAVAPENFEVVQALLSAEVETPFTIVAERSLGVGQVYLRANTSEREIDFAVVLKGISEAFDAFFHQPEREPNNG